MFKLIRSCLFSPSLFKIYGQAPDVGDSYKALAPEKFANKVISSVHNAINVACYTSPFICMYIYKRGFFSWAELEVILGIIATIGGFVVFSYIIRALARASNPTYVEFLYTLNRNNEDPRVYLESIRKYDFEFYAWTPSYTMDPVPSSAWLENKPFDKCANPDLPYYQKITFQLLAYIAIHTFALRLIYPGTLSIVQNLLWSTLNEGRALLVNVYNGKRAKIITADGNAIDTMFVDNRLESSKGNILVICSEGNSGFYEIGIMTVPIASGYSALGWNHPGFAGSTGTPFPKQEQNAMDALIQYAINELGYEPEEIVMYGWSIGGYISTWAVVNYPDIKGLILDACFDDLLPLAENQMPKSWSLLVKEVVRSYMNLNVAEMLAHYSGNVQLIRRTEDEVICIKPNQLSTNRCNFLLIALLEQRHPEFFEVFEKEEEIQEILEACIALSDQQRIVLSRVDLPKIKEAIFPMIPLYMRDFRSTHCTPLPSTIFGPVMELIING